ncbi:hypothetical protein VTK73DRAFT_6630 [Phialemonium thermophilum]|uniref:Uncharacterized protein n=1 Tax=Phialemonium thermophilum TaxID=223376 RepID=A0ABR3XWN0_9PEZI
MSGFPKLIPAFTTQIVLEPPSSVGSGSRGSSLLHVTFSKDSGFLRSEPSYPVRVDAVFVHGADFIKLDPDGRHARLDVQSLLRDKIVPNGFIRFNYTGTVDMSSSAGKVLRNDPDAQSTDYGDIFSHVSFETGSPELIQLEEKVFVGAGHFILEPGQPLIVEYKIAEVVS